jgi:hypothetical protein
MPQTKWTATRVIGVIIARIDQRIAALECVGLNGSYDMVIHELRGHSEAAAAGAELSFEHLDASSRSPSPLR